MSTPITIPVNFDFSRGFAQAPRAAAELERLINSSNRLNSFSGPLGRISSQAGEFAKSLEAANARVLAFGASASILIGVEKAIKLLVTSTIDVEKRLTDINVVLGESSQSLRKFGQDIFTVAKNTGQSYQDVADAALEFSRQGLSLNETLKRTSDAAILARQSGLDLKDAVTGLTAGINSFNKTIITSTDLVNKFAAVDAKFAVSSADLSEALKRVGSTAEDAGVSLDQLLALVTSVQQTTQRGGAVIGNAFKNIFTRISRADVIEQLRELGVEINATQSGVEKLQALANAYSRVGQAQANQIKEAAGGVYQINVVAATLDNLTNKYGAFNEALRTSAGASDEAITRNAELNKTLSALLNTTSVNFSNIFSKFGEISIDSPLRKILGSLNEGLESQVNTDGSVSKFAEGFLKGIAKFIEGPGLIFLSTIGAALGKKLLEFSFSSFKQLNSINRLAQERQTVERGIVQLLERNPIIQQQILTGQLRINDVHAQLINDLRVELQYRERIAGLAKFAAPAVIGAGITFDPETGTPKSSGRRSRAEGLIPSYSEQVAESVGALKAGYRPGKVKAMNMPGRGRIVYNDAERVVDFGLGEPAIIPPQFSKAGAKYRQDFRSKLGFDPYNANGSIPNFVDIQRKRVLGQGLFGRFSEYTRKFNNKQIGIKEFLSYDKASLAGNLSDAIDEYIGGGALRFLEQNDENFAHITSPQIIGLPKAINKKIGYFFGGARLGKEVVPNIDAFKNLGEDYELIKRRLVGNIRGPKQTKFGTLALHDLHDDNITVNEPALKFIKSLPGNAAFGNSTEIDGILKKMSASGGRFNIFDTGLINVDSDLLFAAMDAGFIDRKILGLGVDDIVSKRQTKYASNGNTPNYLDPSFSFYQDAFGDQNFETPYGGGIVQLNGDSARIDAIKVNSAYKGAGKTNALYQGLSSVLKTRGIKSMIGQLRPQYDNKPYADDDVSVIKALLPQLIRGRYGKSSILTLNNRPIRLAGGDNFDASLAKQAQNILVSLRNGGNIDYETFLSNGNIPNFLPTGILSAYRKVYNKLKIGDYKTYDRNPKSRSALIRSAAGFYKFADGSLNFAKDYENDGFIRAHEGAHNILHLLDENPTYNRSVPNLPGKFPLTTALNLSGGPLVSRLLENAATKGFSLPSTLTRLLDYKELYPDVGGSFLEESIADNAFDNQRERSLYTKNLGITAKQADTISKLFKRLRKTGREFNDENTGGITFKSGGAIPNFSPLSDAIERESQSVDPGQIRVSKDIRLAGPNNPAGYGVFNLRDEPGGLGQGIGRAFKEGRDPKKYNVPSFAPLSGGRDPLLPSISGGGPLKFEIVIPTLDRAAASIENAVRDEALETEVIRRNDEKHIRRMEAERTKLDTIARAVRQAGLIQPNTSPGPKIAVADPRPLVRIPTQFQGPNDNNFDPLSNRIELNAQNRTNAALRERAESERAARRARNLELIEPSDPADNIDISRRINERIRRELASVTQGPSPANSEAEFYRLQRQAGAVFSRNSTRQRAIEELRERKLQPDQLAAIESNRQNKIQNLALGSSAIAPIVSELIANTISKDTKSGRVGSAAVSGIGTIAGLASSGFVVSGGNPIGAAIGGLAGGLLALGDVIKEAATNVPELTAKLELLQQKTTDNARAAQEYINISSKLEGIDSGSVSINRGQLRGLNSRRTAALGSLDPQVQSLIRNAIERQRTGESEAGDISEILSRSSINDTQAINLRKAGIGITETSSQLSAGFNNTGASSRNLSELLKFLKGNYLELSPFGASNGGLDRAIDNGFSLLGGPPANSRDARLIATEATKNINEIKNLTNLKGVSLFEILAKDSKFQDTLKSRQPEKIQDAIVTTALSNNFKQEQIDSLRSFFDELNTSGNLGQQRAFNEATRTQLSTGRFNRSEADSKLETGVRRELNNTSLKFVESLYKLENALQETGRALDVNLTGRLNTLQLQNQSQIISLGGSFDRENLTNGDRSIALNQRTLGLRQLANRRSEDSLSNQNTFARAIFDSSKALSSQLLNEFDERAIKEKGDITRLENRRTGITSFLDKSIGPLTSQPATVENANKLLSEISDARSTLSQVLKDTNLTEINSGAGVLNRDDITDLFKALRGLEEKTRSASEALTRQETQAAADYEKSRSALTLETEERIKTLSAIGKLNLAVQTSSNTFDRNNSLAKERFATELNRSNLRSEVAGLPLVGFDKLRADLDRDIFSAQSQSDFAKSRVAPDLLGQARRAGGALGSDLRGAQIGTLDAVEARISQLQQSASSTKDEASLAKINDLLEQYLLLQDNIVSKQTELNQLLPEQLARLQEINKAEREKLAFQSAFSDERQKLNLSGIEGRIRDGQGITSGDFRSVIGGELAYSSKDFQRDAISGVQDVTKSIKSSFASATADVIKNGRNIGDALTGVLTNVLGSIIDKTSEISTNFLFKGLSSAVGFSSGGVVTGGSGVKDDVPAVLTKGEYVIKKDVVRKIGVENLERLNNGVDFSLENKFDYDNALRPKTGTNIYSGALSSIALTDVDFNRSNATRLEREESLINYRTEYEQYEDQKSAAMKAFKDQKSNRFYGALISAGLGVAGSAIGQYAQSARLSSGRLAAGTNFNSGASVQRSIMNYGVIQRASGGSIFGGNQASDNVPALLTAGEYVMKKSAVNKKGLAYFNKLNNGYAEGGVVRPAVNPPSIMIPGSEPVGGNTSQTLNNVTINITINSEGKADVNSKDTSSDKDRATQSKQFSEKIKGEVLKVINQEQKQGGSLYKLVRQ